MPEYCSPNGMTVHKCSLSQIFGKFHIPQLDATHPAAKLLDDAVVRDGLTDHGWAHELWMAMLGLNETVSQQKAQGTPTPVGCLMQSSFSGGRRCRLPLNAIAA
jgi:hypothetical protein